MGRFRTNKIKEFCGKGFGEEIAFDNAVINTWYFGLNHKLDYTFLRVDTPVKAGEELIAFVCALVGGNQKKIDYRAVFKERVRLYTVNPNLYAMLNSLVADHDKENRID